MTPKNFILATAGHVDHGKTALIKAVTGTDTDRLPEEKARGITIDLGFAHLALPGFSIGIIDVPGHEDFVRNMIAGVGSIDLALLVVAADDGWMPQTEEHLQILSYLGVARLVVALTKSDLGRVAERREEIRAKLAGAAFADAPIVETSIAAATSLQNLRATLSAEFATLPPLPEGEMPRLFVDRVFTVRGSGTVVTGTLSGSPIARGTTVRVLPQNRTARVRTIQSHNQTLELAEPRTRTALNLADLHADDVTRGSVVTLPDHGEPSSVLDVILERSARLPPTARPLKSGATLHIHHGSGRIAARVQLRDRKELLPNEKAIARLHLRSPICASVGDRFIVRDSSEQVTLAGGTMLDLNPGSIRLRSIPQRALLDERGRSPTDLAVRLRTLLQRDHFARRTDLPAGALGADENVFLGEKIAADATWWANQKKTAAKLIDAEHAAHPEHPGLELNRLREGMKIAEPAVFEELLRDLVRSGFTQTRNFVARSTYRPSLPPTLRAAGERIRAALAARPLDPPARRELASTAEAQQALRFLSESGEVISLGDEVAISADGFRRLRDAVVTHLRAGKTGTVSELRQATGTTRRIIVPLLERLDKMGLTTRDGDRRRLR